MKALLQRVTEATVKVNDIFGKKIRVGRIFGGLLILLGVESGDTEEDADRLADKTVKLRIFEDENGKMNKNVVESGGSILVVSQFTLCADVRRGNRPDFTSAERPERAKALYEYFTASLEKNGVSVKRGVFGADMKVSLINDGPVTVMIDSNELKRSRKS